MDDEGLIKIFSTKNKADFSLAKSLLRSADIDYSIPDPERSEIYVRENNKDKAEVLLKDIGVQMNEHKPQRSDISQIISIITIAAIIILILVVLIIT